jgi:hypothetical protein
MIELVKAVKAAEEKTAKLRVALKAVQEVCEHQWFDDGHDSHHSYQRCAKCDVTERT